ncbi:MAG: efflux RND transporter periplasmic adaptor subunit, partial [Kordiimonadaceae bacterium]|nr:efflux RND transporter periplasmic adaptor subunit [Kordiimonadaceae bacterium]
GTMAQQQPKAPPALVEVADAKNEMMAPQIFMPGTIVSRNDSRIAAEITGRVLWVASEGALVEEGDIIAKLDAQIITLNVARNKSQITRLEARVKYEKSNLKRTADLAKTQHVSTSQLEEAESSLIMTEQELEQARIALAQSEINLSRTKVRAPFPGRVVARLAQIGEYATPGRQIIRLVDTQHLEISAQAPVKLANILSDNLTVSLRRGTMVIDAKIRALVPVGNAISRTMEIRVSIPEGSHYVVGSAVQVGLPSSAPEQVVSIPRDALVLRREGTFVFRIKDDNTAERLLVRTGSATGSFVAVKGGITGGDRVVVRGGERLRPGQAVKFKSSGAASVRTKQPPRSVAG